MSYITKLIRLSCYPRLHVMSLFQRLFPWKSKTTALQPAQVFVSQPGEAIGAPKTPLLIFGHESDTTARFISESTTITCISVHIVEFIKDFASEHPTLGLIAQSRREHSGEAGYAIQLFHTVAKYRAMTIYGAWDYNVERAARKAIEYGADGIEMPGMIDSEVFAYLLGVLKEVAEEAPVPTTVEEHIARLKRYTTDKSPFWSQQNQIFSKYY